MQITLWAMATVIMSFGAFKKPTLKLLHKENIWLDNHKTSMTELHTSLLGSFCNAHYPNSCHHNKIAANINARLDAHFHENKSVLIPFANTFPTLYGWKGTEAPTVIVETVKPKWRKGGQYTTWDIGLHTPKKFRALVRRMLKELDLTLNDGKAMFVDLNMQYGGQALHLEYGKLLFKQQAYIKKHDVANIFGINISTSMHTLSLTDIPGIVSVKTTPNTHRTGHRKILMSTPNTHAALKEVDSRTQTQPQSFPDVRPTWQGKPIEIRTVRTVRIAID